MTLSQSLAERLGLSLSVRRAGRSDVAQFVSRIDAWSLGDPGHLGSNPTQIAQRVSLLVNPTSRTLAAPVALWFRVEAREEHVREELAPRIPRDETQFVSPAAAPCHGSTISNSYCVSARN